MQSMNVNGMQVIVLSQPGPQNEQLTQGSMTPRLAKQLIGLGVVHILNGVFCIIFQSISLKNFLDAEGGGPRFGLAMVGHGFWSGLSFLVTGIIGITAGVRKSNCQVVVFNILSIISAALASTLMILAVISANFVFQNLEDRFRRSSKFYDERTTILVMESMLAAVGILEGIIALWSSIICCLIIGVCNCCLAFTPETQPLILSAEQQAALMSNPMFLSNQQQSAVGFNTNQHNRRQPDVPPHAHSNFMSAATVEGSYTGLNTGMRRSLLSPYTNASTYEEIHDYLEAV